MVWKRELFMLGLFYAYRMYLSLNKWAMSIVVVGLLYISSVGCNSGEYRKKLTKTDEVIILPAQLNEISGLHWLNDTTIVCVQDEKGILYYYNTRKKGIQKEVVFKQDRDYEGVTAIDQTYFILQSNGTIKEVIDTTVMMSYDFKSCNKSDFEGLCLDKANQRLLVACKQPCKDQDLDDILVYQFSLETKTYAEKPLFKIKKKAVHKNFTCSGIAIHPNGQIFILSSFSKTLLTLSKQGEIISKIQLDDYVFHQPEGITFSDKGELFISNEKHKSRPTLIKIDNLK